MPDTDITIRDVTFETEDFRYRTPIKFGGVALDRVTLLNATVTVETRTGRIATGFGSMPLGNVWAWPSKALTYEDTLSGMKRAAARIADHYRTCPLVGHPIEITHTMEPVLFEEAAEAAPGIPHLATLVAASPFDAALHDAYGKAHGRNCYQTYGPQFLEQDLAAFLGADFAGESLEQYLLDEPKATMPLYHLVGALDPLTTIDVATPVNDGLPETLAEWITREGLTHLKIKLNGDDLAWDLSRVVSVNRVAEVSAPQRVWQFSLDFNERCQNVEYLLEFLRRLQSDSPIAYDRVQYIEQPTARDLKANPKNVMHAAAKLKPVVIDESLLDLESLHLACDLGYTGVAFKACKGQTQTLLLAAAAQKMKLFLCVQDLTCPGASLIHSAGLAAHIPGVAAIESNGRQYCPSANTKWDAKFPGLFAIANGVMQTGQLTGLGLSAV
ncbi:mandelate racemase/muconate lactonizing enzyme family protein [soil metagenome]